MKDKLNQLIIISVAAVVFACSFSGCGNGNSGSGSVTPTPAASPRAAPLTGFAADLQYIRNGQFTYVWLFSRKDGKPLDKSDGEYLRTNAPQVVDWVKTDEDRKIFAGTNFNLEEGNLNLLRKRFVVEDYSGK